ncbi:hypothetical protein GY45DRAFT_765071 [Cubamyces sp. BRFM 1775]|nr:hypothetical protein GY45DRAFT_765071 [Cubamyces sp. BRFM 1775]
MLTSSLGHSHVFSAPTVGRASPARVLSRLSGHQRFPMDGAGETRVAGTRLLTERVAVFFEIRERGEDTVILHTAPVSSDIGASASVRHLSPRHRLDTRSPSCTILAGRPQRPSERVHALGSMIIHALVDRSALLGDLTCSWPQSFCGSVAAVHRLESKSGSPWQVRCARRATRWAR